MCDGNYIKLNRKMLEWEWFSDANTYRVFTYCLLKANWKDARFEGRDIPRGSFVTSYPSMSSDLKLTARQIRTSINHLKVTGEVSVKITSKFSIITVNNYSRYQEDVRQASVKRQASVSQTTGKCQSSVTNRRRKEDKEIKNNIYSDIPELNQKILDFKEHRKLLGKPMTEYAVKLMIGKLNKITVDYDIQIKILEQSIDNGWQGIFPLKDNVQKSASQPKPNKFNSFEGQRDYDFASIEKQLLENNK